jgi:hypothetical protein
MWMLMLCVDELYVDVNVLCMNELCGCEYCL